MKSCAIILRLLGTAIDEVNMFFPGFKRQAIAFMNQVPIQIYGDLGTMFSTIINDVETLIQVPPGKPITTT
jgi:hypothetical protein